MCSLTALPFPILFLCLVAVLPALWHPGAGYCRAGSGGLGVAGICELGACRLDCGLPPVTGVFFGIAHSRRS